MSLSKEELARYKLLEKNFLNRLTKMSDTMVRKNFKNPHVLSALQVAALDFLGSVMMANIKVLTHKIDQTEATLDIKLDYVEHIRELANHMFDQIKTSIKSVELH